MTVKEALSTHAGARRLFVQAMLLKRRAGNVERENDKWEQNRELERKLLIELEFKLGFDPIFNILGSRIYYIILKILQTLFWTVDSAQSSITNLLTGGSSDRDNYWKTDNEKGLAYYLKLETLWRPTWRF